MTDKIPFKGWITFEDSLRVEKILFRKKILSFHRIVTGLGIVVISSLILATEVPILVTIFTMLFGAGIVGGTLWYSKRSMYKAKSESYAKETQVERCGSLSSENIKVTSDKAKNEINWEFFSRIEESENLVIVAKDDYYVAFAPYMFGNLMDWERCKNLFNKIKKQFNKSARPDQ
ncbi:MAG: hypothetical protein M0T70_03595 [Geobacteraceae bacterium]|nr:hypothetical protein [Geobacteraceae bacterium]